MNACPNADPTRSALSRWERRTQRNRRLAERSFDAPRDQQRDLFIQDQVRGLLRPNAGRLPEGHPSAKLDVVEARGRPAPAAAMP